ncbi:hornerin-like [Anguilla anguilla]|uniref:hornerin-like n=1 Tax=Anguilla anguilla TaxID=7936 RepID=UPI0015AED1D1|nr:hornerin-like [Anguilla anguilla]
MPPLPLDERIVVIQRPKSLPLRADSPQTTSQQPQNTSTRSGLPPPPTQPQAQSHPHPGCSSSSSSERRRRSSRVRRSKGERGTAVSGNSDTLGHSRHSDGTVTLGSGHKHTHTIDIKLSLGTNGGAGGIVPGKAQGSSLSRNGSVKGNKDKKVSLHLDLGQGGRKSGGTLGKEGGAVQQLQNHPQNKNKTQANSHHPQNQLSVPPGGVFGLVPAQGQHPKLGKERDQDVALQSYAAVASHPSRAFKEAPCTGNKENSKLGPTLHPSNSHCLPHQHCAPHASVLSARYPALSPLFSQPQLPFHHQSSQPRPSRSRERPLQHGPPTSRSSSRGGGFPSPDHTCTLNLAHPFNCGCWRLVRCSGGGRSAGCRGGGIAGIGGGGGGRGSNSRVTGLKNFAGCLSASSTTNTSSSNSTMSDCQAGLLRPLGCAPCSGGGADFESPAALRKKLVAGCLPCAPLSSSAPLRALQSCVAGCNPKASQTGSSTCSYCSSDPIVIAYNPRGGKGSGAGRGTGGADRGARSAGVFSGDDDGYSVRTIWPEELARKMTRSKPLQNREYGGAGPGASGTCDGHGRSGGDGTSPVILDCRNLLEFTQSQLTDRAGRRRLQQGKMAVLDFIGSGAGRDAGRESLKRLWTKGGESGCGDSNTLNGDATLPSSTSAHCPTTHSPPPFSPPPSGHATLTKPKARVRENGHSPPPHPLPSAQSLHLVLNSLNREQDGENGKAYPSEPPLSLPPSSSLPASLSDEGVMTPDIENAALSAILPFLFLGNERDAQDLELLLRLNIGFVVNVTTHLPLYHLATGLVRYKRLPATDSSKQNLRQYFEEVFEFIEEAHQSGRGVLVHCQAGVSRSATIVIAYLMKHTLMTMTDAYKYVKSRRPVVSPNLNFMGQLLEFERDLNSGVTPRILTPKLSGLETQV